jgi:hypothetical protein
VSIAEATVGGGDVGPRRRMMLIVVLGRAAITWVPLPMRTLEWSSPTVTSRTQCKEFSIVQCERIYRDLTVGVIGRSEVELG